ncbi:tRNA (5-methylaminomethyl-2-thiouridylate)-methyltransferase [Allomyces macrogynus ATCC 38327]|uniref:tRNA-5-taurinomethyluridine 2-sulfurtransferase n=1 Tax=Allomyces macrogynus (strain ATCC 38327) TaxID=578462 RepID=A0A0L0SRN9_ALLM3|nr:tRNA (5-methylaminomethyl-2-thiouridylate)-methyltransferase [Allomyces macrogynus ATCC 38327]|eukprot:KNE65030.1 tRNA (5-methylaminomethyl-2-thiouridylate)-methyltransferase [Allomyces macrogynus ATCC 38327]
MAMSGGVDSAIAAHLLLSAGHRVTGIYMRNWDSTDETGVCTSDADWADVQAACRTLGIPSVRVDFVKEYWGQVFETALGEFEQGRTPNPDVWCNREIKFGALARRVLVEGVPGQGRFEYLATGHYARRVPLPNCDSARFQVARGLDAGKDQSYFLAAIDGNVLPRVLFPLGRAHKRDIKALARAVGLAKWADKKESMGICFIGKRRRFGDFLDGYIEPQPGHFILEDGTIVGAHDGLAKYTIGQAAKIHSQKDRYFVAHKDAKTGDVLVVPGRDHPRLFARKLRASWVRWIHPENEARALGGGVDGLTAQIRYRQEPVPCRVEKRPDGTYTVHLAHAVRAVTPGQVVAVYDGDVCLGCGLQMESDGLESVEEVGSEGSE